MDIKKLEVLLKVIETESLTTAGEEMGFTQSGVSHLIKSIEAELGFQVLIRGRQGVRLTDNGDALLPTIREMVNANERMCQIAANIRGMRSGRIRIGTYPSTSVVWLPAIIGRFSRDYPGIRIELFEGGNERLNMLLDESAIDFAFMSSPNEGYELIPLATDRILAILPHGHAFARRRRITLAELATQPFIMPAAGFDYDIECILTKCNPRPTPAYSSMDNHAIIAMVQHGLGVSIVSEMMLDGLSTNVLTKELEPKEHRSLGIVVRSLRSASLAARTFIKYSQNMAAELGAKAL